MGDWDTYCLLCSGTTNTTKIGSSKPSALEKRRRKNRQRRNGEESSDKEYYELSGDDDEDRVYDEDEDRSYDPTLVTKESSGWVLEQRCLGLNTDGDEEGGDEEDARAWIGEGNIHTYGSFDIETRTDPNQPEETSFSCYNEYLDNDDAVFPFHASCLELLARFLANSSDINAVDKVALYRALWDNDCTGYGTGVEGCDGQYWTCYPGEEFAVTDPVTIPGLVEFIQDRFQTKPTRTSEDEGAGKRDATTKPWLNDSTLSTDPFSVLPVELLHEILSYLPAKDILALSSASMAFLGASRRNRVWKNLIVHDFPWFWELEELLAGCRSSGRGLDLNLDLDCKRLYLWLGERTELLRYNEGPFLGLVNRRRIWGACAEVKGLYLRKLEVKASA